MPREEEMVNGVQRAVGETASPPRERVQRERERRV
jgi:hypothetical protein